MQKQPKTNATQRDVVSVQVGTDLTVQVIPNKEHEFLMTSRDVAIGYGISESNLRSAKSHNSAELVEGEHYFACVSKMDAGKPPVRMTHWTKAGVVRLGFYIKSERAKLFRDWAEKIIIQKLSVPSVHLPAVKAPKKHNLLAKERLADLLIDVCQIPNNKLRMSILNKLTQNHA